MVNLSVKLVVEVGKTHYCWIGDLTKLLSLINYIHLFIVLEISDTLLTSYNNVYNTHFK